MNNCFNPSELILFNVPTRLIELSKTDPTAAEKEINDCQEQLSLSSAIKAFRRSLKCSSRKNKRPPQVLDSESPEPPLLAPLAPLSLFSDSIGPSRLANLRAESFSIVSSEEEDKEVEADTLRRRKKTPSKHVELAGMESKDQRVSPKKRQFIISSDESDEEIGGLDFICQDVDVLEEKSTVENEVESTASKKISSSEEACNAPQAASSLSKIDCESTSSTTSHKLLNSESDSSVVSLPKAKRVEKKSRYSVGADLEEASNGVDAASDSSNDQPIVSLDSNHDISSDEELSDNPPASKPPSNGKKAAAKNNQKKSKVTEESGAEGDVPAKKKRKRRKQCNSSDSEVEAKSKSKKSKAGKNKKKGRVTYYQDDENSDDEINCVSSDEDCEEKKAAKEEEDKKREAQKNNRRRKILTMHEVQQETRLASREENERRRRIKERQELYNELTAQLESNSTAINKSRVILEFDPETKEPVVEVQEYLSSQLKRHQVEGIQFMYTATVESHKFLEDDSPGSGCILAHSMGLGKTLQVITFIHTLLSNRLTKDHIRRVLIICPKNTVKNWVSEFRSWLYDNSLTDFITADFEDYEREANRSKALEEFVNIGGVLIINTNIFPKLVHPLLETDGNKKKAPAKKGKKNNKNTKYSEIIERALLNAPDLVVVDEGHLIKSDKTKLNKAVNALATRRRVILTGTPLQNNLTEYYHMVNFVKPNLLGTHKEFKNRFKNPIDNGQMEDSGPEEVRLMKRRVHILHRLLQDCVHRRDYTVLAPYLKPKLEYVLKVQLSDLQIDLYKEYLDKYARNSQSHRQYLFKDCIIFRLICAHPYLLREAARREDDKNEIDDFIDDNSSYDSEGSLEAYDAAGDILPPASKRVTRSAKGDEETPSPIYFNDGDWFEPMIPKTLKEESIEIGSKINLLFNILAICDKIGDKLLVFSQSLDTLNIIEVFLELITSKPHLLSSLIGDASSSEDIQTTWYNNIDYFRLDGQSKSETRKSMIEKFNDPENTRARLFLISTKAGSLGINLVGANRCIIFDSSWNPADDIQAIFRIYRFGQNKPVYVYRFVTYGTMEQRIYERQIIKQALSRRVVDDQEIVRHFKENEIAELYRFEPRPEEEKTPSVPKDKLLGDILVSEKSCKLIVEYHLQDSLLENRPEEELPDNERDEAWEQYLADRKREEDELRRQEEQARINEQQLRHMQQMKQREIMCYQIYDQIRENRQFDSMQALDSWMDEQLATKIGSIDESLTNPSTENVELLKLQIAQLKQARESWPSFKTYYTMNRPLWKPQQPLPNPSSNDLLTAQVRQYLQRTAPTQFDEAAIQRFMQTYQGLLTNSSLSQLPQ